jgi:hypothetical protein
VHVGLIAAGCLPFAAGAIVPADGDTGLFCPFRELTGLPCPLCGASRAFALAARADLGFTRYNAVWVLAALVLIVAGLTGRRPGLRAGVLAVAAAWIYAYAARAAIT